MIDSLFRLSNALTALPLQAWLSAGLLLLPALLSLYLRPSPEVEPDPQKVRRLRWTLIASSLAYTTMHLGYLAWQWKLLAPSGLQPTGLGILVPVFLFVWQPWWFLVLLARELRGKNTPSFPTGRKRAANLNSRTAASPVRNSAWVPGWIAWAGVALWLALSGADGGLVSWTSWFLLACSAFLFAMGPSKIREALESQAEPHPPGGDESIAQAYEVHRGVTAWMMFRCLTVAGLGNLIFALGLTAGLVHQPVFWVTAAVLGALALLEAVVYYARRRRIVALQQLLLVEREN